MKKAFDMLERNCRHCQYTASGKMSDDGWRMARSSSLTVDDDSDHFCDPAEGT